MQLRHQPAGAGGDAAPIVKPSAWKAQRDCGGVDLPLIQAGAAHGADLARAAGEELLGRRPDIDQILAVVGRAGAKRHDGEPVRAGTGLGFDIARIDRPQPVRGRQDRARSVASTGFATVSPSCSATGRTPLASDCGGLSDGHRKARSTRSWGPGWRCTAARIAAGGTSNSTLATVIGIAGPLSGTGVLGHVGHSM